MELAFLPVETRSPDREVWKQGLSYTILSMLIQKQEVGAEPNILCLWQAYRGYCCCWSLGSLRIVRTALEPGPVSLCCHLICLHEGLWNLHVWRLTITIDSHRGRHRTLCVPGPVSKTLPCPCESCRARQIWVGTWIIWLPNCYHLLESKSLNLQKGISIFLLLKLVGSWK